METYYLIDFENVHNEGLENLDSLNPGDHVHIFYTENALNISLDIILSKGTGVEIVGHKVPVRKQSLDMHLVSYLGYLLGSHTEQCAYVIVSKDTDYDNIIKYWRDKGYKQIKRKAQVAEKASAEQEIAAGKAEQEKKDAFSGEERDKLNHYMQHCLLEKGYSTQDVGRLCKIVNANCNLQHPLQKIYNGITKQYGKKATAYQDVKEIWNQYGKKDASGQLEKKATQDKPLLTEQSDSQNAVPKGWRGQQPVTTKQIETEKTQKATRKKKDSKEKSQQSVGKKKAAKGKDQQTAGKKKAAKEKDQQSVGKKKVAAEKDQQTAGKKKAVKEKAKGKDQQIEEVKEPKNAAQKKEAKVRSFFGQHFKRKQYVEKKEETIQIILQAKSRQEMNNALTKLYPSEVVGAMMKTLKPFNKDLPGR